MGEILLTPTKIYVKPVLNLIENVRVKAVSHITGGGLIENIPRSMPEGLSAKIEKKALRVPLIFDLIAKTGNIPERDMFNTFNMGAGMCVTVDKDDADKAIGLLNSFGQEAYIIGEIIVSEEGVIIC